MSKSLTASKKLMQNYLSELLTDSVNNEQQVPDKQIIQQEKAVHQVQNEGNQSLERLLKGVSAPLDIPVEEKQSTKETLSTTKNEASAIIQERKAYREGDFQAMFFDVAGLTIAVPLIELGGIHEVDKINNLMGKPDWFKGVMLHRDDKINIVDTALWVMPDKCDEKLIESLNYQYVIMLNDSNWGLMAEHLIDTVTLTQEQVKWQEPSGKRPWLSGLVKEKMCALLDVSALIKLLDAGNNIYQGN